MTTRFIEATRIARRRRGLLRDACVAGAVVAWITSVTGEAHAAPDLPLQLEWHAPAGCPSAGQVLAHVARMVGEGRALAPVAARGEVSRTGAQAFKLVMVTRVASGDETRTIEARSCASLAQAAAIVIAVALDPARSAAAPTAAPAAPTPRDPDAEDFLLPSLLVGSSDGERRAPVTVPAREPLGYRLLAGASAALDVGTLPAPVPGLTVSASLDVGRWRGGLAVGAFLPAETREVDGSGAAARITMLCGGAYGCYAWELGRLRVGPCAGVDATFAEVVGVHVFDPRSTLVLWPTAAAGGLVELPLSSLLRLSARLDLLFPVQAPDFSADSSSGPTLLHRPALPSLRLQVGITMGIL